MPSPIRLRAAAVFAGRRLPHRTSCQSFAPSRAERIERCFRKLRPDGRQKTAAALRRIGEGMTAEQRELYGKTFDTFAATLNGMQDSGLDSASAAKRVIELAEQMPAPSRGAVGTDAEEILRFVHEKSDANRMRCASRWSA